MLRWLLNRRLDAFEKTYGYDLDYARDILEASPAALIKYGLIESFASHREGVPKDAWFAASLAATLHEDCGPCTQLIAEMARRSGVEASLLRAIVRGDAALTPDAQLGLLFARATLAKSPGADALRAEILERWGPRALVSLAFAIASSRVYPTLRQAMGYGARCTLVRVGDEDIWPKPLTT